jgi:glutamine cyclotransferase
MLKIEMPRNELTMAPEVTIGSRKRFSTATAVAFINENLLVSAAFNSRKIYLIELTETGHNIIQEVKTKHSPDLMKFKNGFILTSDYPYMEPDGHASIYDFIDGKIVFRKEIKINNTKAHGCEIVDDQTVIITSNSDHNRGIMFLDIETGAIKQNFNNFKYYPKDVCIVGDYLFIVTSQSLPQIGLTTVIRESIIYVFDKNTLEKIDELSFHGQTDSILVNGEDGFISVQGDDTVLHFKFINGKLSFIKNIPGFNFPHGIARIGNKVAITNYGDNSIRIFDIDELKNL